MDSSLLIFAMCGLGLVCLGVLGVLAFMLLRATNKTFLGPLLGLLSGQAAGRDVPDDDPLPVRSQRRTGISQSVQAQPQSLDFDSAVARYRQQPPPNVPLTPPQSPSFSAQSAPTQNNPQPPPPLTPLRPPTVNPPASPAPPAPPQQSSSFGNTGPAQTFGTSPLGNTQPPLRNNRNRRRDLDDIGPDVDDDMVG